MDGVEINAGSWELLFNVELYFNQTSIVKLCEKHESRYVSGLVIRVDLPFSEICYRK